MESIFDPKMPWYDIRHQRCLIAVRGIMEHREIKGFKNKVPYFIKLACDTHLFLPVSIITRLSEILKQAKFWVPIQLLHGLQMM